MIKKLDVRRASGSIVSLVAKPSTRLARVMDSIELYGKSRITYIEDVKGKPHSPKFLGDPDVWRIDPLVIKGKPQGVLMTKEFQHWIYRINVEMQRGVRFASDAEYNAFWQAELLAWKRKNGGQTIKDYTSFRSKASHTNSAEVDRYANYITGENLNNGHPVFSNIVTGRWVGELVNESRSSMRVINASKGYLHLHPFEQPLLFDQPLITGREFVGSTNVILHDDIRRPYGDFNDKAVMPVILPVDDECVFPDAELVIPSDEPPLSKFNR